MALGTRILLGIPTLRTSRRSVSWINALCDLQMPLGSSLGRQWVQDETIANARNALCEDALRIGADYLVFLGDDVLPPPNMLLLMLDRIGREFPLTDGGPARASMISGVYWTKTYPPEPYLWNGLLRGSYRDWTAGEFFPVDLAGCDALMIETAVLRGMPRPWFSTDWVWEDGQRPSSIATEDFYFFTKTRKHGFRLFADTSIQCAHEDRDTGAMFGITSEMRQAGGSPETPDDAELLVAELGAGLAAPTYGGRATVIRFDLRAEVKPDVRCDVRHVPEQYHGRFDLVSASHLLEHFDRREAPGLVAHWARLLKPGGKLVIRVPNVAYAMRRILAAEAGEGHADAYDWAQLYGDQKGAGPAFHHNNGFTAKKLRKLLEGCPLLGEVEITETDEGGEPGLNLKATASLAREDVPEAIGPWWAEIAEREDGAPAASSADAPAEAGGDAVLPVPAGQLAVNGHTGERVPEEISIP